MFLLLSHYYVFFNGETKSGGGLPGGRAGILPARPHNRVAGLGLFCFPPHGAAAPSSAELVPDVSCAGLKIPLFPSTGEIVEERGGGEEAWDYLVLRNFALAA